MPIMYHLITLVMKITSKHTQNYNSTLLGITSHLFGTAKLQKPNPDAATVMRPKGHDGAGAISRNWGKPPLAPAATSAHHILQLLQVARLNFYPCLLYLYHYFHHRPHFYSWGKKSILVLVLRRLVSSYMTFYCRNPTVSTKG